jgi:hypothetical protein
MRIRLIISKLAHSVHLFWSRDQSLNIGPDMTRLTKNHCTMCTRIKSGSGGECGLPLRMALTTNGIVLTYTLYSSTRS